MNNWEKSQYKLLCNVAKVLSNNGIAVYDPCKGDDTLTVALDKDGETGTIEMTLCGFHPEYNSNGGVMLWDDYYVEFSLNAIDENMVDLVNTLKAERKQFQKTMRKIESKRKLNEIA